jgi:hypothetical protein
VKDACITLCHGSAAVRLPSLARSLETCTFRVSTGYLVCSSLSTRQKEHWDGRSLSLRRRFKELSAAPPIRLFSPLTANFGRTLS